MRLPIVALVVPVLLSIVMWVITGSPLSLLFGLMGPIMALANYLDQRIQSKRSQQTQLDTALSGETQDLIEQQKVELAFREEQLRQFPSSQYWSEQTANLRPYWAVEQPEQSLPDEIRIGIERETGLPLTIDPRAGVVVIGDEVETRSIMRSLAVQLSWRAGIETYGFSDIDKDMEPELEEFMVAQQKLLHRSTGTIPAGVRYVIETQEGRGVLRDLLGQELRSFEVLWDFLTRAEHQKILDLYAAEKKLLSNVGTERIPDVVLARMSFPPSAESARQHMPVFVGESAAQAVFLDLIEDGPHAIVVGKTGSGKTEFVKTWITALCAGYSPQSVSFLIIDYKGGTGFHNLSTLPHIHAVVTDLGHDETSRIVHSLRAELKTREKLLLENDAHDIGSLADFVEISRLVIVIDEYRALLDLEPELGVIISDIASRGRSLGMHLILSTQRLSGVVSDSITANCSLRVSFAQTDKHENSLFLGSPLQIESTSKPGRAHCVSALRNVVEFQSALTSPQQVTDLCEFAWPHREINPPWLEPLAQIVPFEHAPSEQKIWLGLADYPEKQIQQWISLDATALLIVGRAGSGKTNTTKLLARQLGVNVIQSAEQLWDVVFEEENTKPVIIDDFDFLLDQMGIEHKDELIQHVPSWLRYQRQRSQFVALSLMEQSRYELLWQAHFQTKILLETAAIPGRACLGDVFLQIALTDAQHAEMPVLNRLEFHLGHSYIFISRHVTKVRKILETSHNLELLQPGEISESGNDKATIYLGNIEQWQENYVGLTKLKNTSHVIFDSCTPAEVRSLRIHAGLLPFAAVGTLIVKTPDGILTRACLGEDCV